jgi:hydrogenase nickel incorporation protein HypA/HybF
VRARAEKSGVHELAVMQAVVEGVSERLGPRRVTRVRLEIGREAAVVPEAAAFCFEVCALGTTLEGAMLEIVEGAGGELRILDVTAEVR